MKAYRKKKLRSEKNEEFNDLIQKLKATCMTHPFEIKNPNIINRGRPFMLDHGDIIDGELMKNADYINIDYINIDYIDRSNSDCIEIIRENQDKLRKLGYKVTFNDKEVQYVDTIKEVGKHKYVYMKLLGFIPLTSTRRVYERVYKTFTQTSVTISYE